jgi:putative endonuclease
MFYVYIAQCNDGSLYTGWTTDIERRIRQHSEGRGSKYTRSRTPVTLKYLEEYTTKPEAMKREAMIKKLSRSEKLDLISNT